MQGKETILMVEDEEVVRNLTVRMLQTLGYGTLQARHGVEALEICQTYGQADRPDPDRHDHAADERQAVRRGTAPAGREVKVLFVSGYSSDDTVGGKPIGVDTPLIQKPFTREQLARKIREVLDAKE